MLSLQRFASHKLTLTELSVYQTLRVLGSEAKALSRGLMVWMGAAGSVTGILTPTF